MIIAVAGFGILAIFSMIVVEKTRDIGILKALGASNRGVMKIFLGYGLLLGVVGAVLGTVLGLSITIYINEIEQFLTEVHRARILRPHGLLLQRDPDRRSAVAAWSLVNARRGRHRRAVQRAAGAAGRAAASGAGAAVRVIAN